MGKDYIYAVAPLLEDALIDRDLVHRQTAASVVQHMSLGVAGLGCEDGLTHLLNLVWPNIFETSPHLVNAVMGAIDGCRLALGPPIVLNYVLQVSQQFCSLCGSSDSPLDIFSQNQMRGYRRCRVCSTQQGRSGKPIGRSTTTYILELRTLWWLATRGLRTRGPTHSTGTSWTCSFRSAVELPRITAVSGSVLAPSVPGEPCEDDFAVVSVPLLSADRGECRLDRAHTSICLRREVLSVNVRWKAPGGQGFRALVTCS